MMNIMNPPADWSTLKKLLWLRGNPATGGSAKHYVARWDMVENTLTRMESAADITTTTTNFCHLGSVNQNYNNPFDSIYPWKDRKLCNISIDAYRGLTAGASLKNCVTHWEGEAGFSYSDPAGVWVYTPPFSGRTWDDGTYRYFDVVSSKNQYDGFVYYPESMTGRWFGADVMLTIDGASKHCNLPIVGMPMANVPLTNQQTYANNYGATLNDIYTLDATYLLFIVEYANMNLQLSIGNGVSDLYAQGLHPVADVTDSTTITLSGLTDAQKACFIPNAIVDIGTSDGGNQTARTYIVSAVTADTMTTVTLADAVTCDTSAYVSVHGLINIADADIGSHSGYIGTNSKANAYYRGETFYANKFQYVLGAYRQTGTGKIWIAGKGETDKYNALDTAKHSDTGIALATTSGYIKSLATYTGLCVPPFVTETGGNSTMPVGDYLYVPALSAGNTVLLLGGNAGNGTGCGLYGNWHYPAGYSNWNYGSHPRLKTP